MMEQLDLTARLRAIVGTGGRRRVHPVHLVLLAFMVGSLAGMERLAHFDAFQGDSLVTRALRFTRWPVRKVVSLALASLSDAQRDALVDLISEVGLASLPEGTKSVIIDLDPTAIVSYGDAEDAAFGYCGKGRRRKRHFPLVASVAETRAIVLVRYRDGSALTGDELVTFLTEVVRRVHAQLGEDCIITIRGDAGLWNAKVRNWLREHHVPFAMAMPLAPGIKLYARAAAFSAVNEDPDVEAAVLDGEKVGAGAGVRVVVLRRRVHDPKAPPQGKVILGDPGWRYQAIVCDRDWAAGDIWRFYNGRADCERVFRVGKQALALGNLVGHAYRANEVAFLLRSLAYNVDLRFQGHCEERARARGRRVLQVGLEWRQPRFYRSPGRLTCAAGRWILHVPNQRLLAELWTFYDQEVTHRRAGLAAEVAAA